MRVDVTCAHGAEVRLYRPGDERALADLHARAYPASPARSAALWRWRHRENPRGTTEIVLALDGTGRCLAAHAGVVLPLLLEGREVLGGLQGDVALDPDLHHTRRGLSLVVATAQRHFDAWFGGDVPLIWGFPEPSPLRIGLLHLRYEVLRDVVALVHDGSGTRPRAPGGIAIADVPRFGAAGDRIWSLCRGELGTGTVRDARYLDWRYADHPEVDYRLLLARDGGAPRGLAVLRRGGWDDRALMLMELLVPADDEDAEAALLDRALELVGEERREALVAWVAGHPGRFRAWQRRFGFYAHATPWQECFRCAESRLKRRWLTERWRQSFGDVDFF